MCPLTLPNTSPCRGYCFLTPRSALALPPESPFLSDSRRIGAVRPTPEIL